MPGRPTVVLIRWPGPATEHSRVGRMAVPPAPVGNRRYLAPHQPDPGVGGTWMTFLPTAPPAHLGAPGIFKPQRPGQSTKLRRGGSSAEHWGRLGRAAAPRKGLIALVRTPAASLCRAHNRPARRPRPSRGRYPGQDQQPGCDQLVTDSSFRMGQPVTGKVPATSARMPFRPSAATASRSSSGRKLSSWAAGNASRVRAELGSGRRSTRCTVSPVRSHDWWGTARRGLLPLEVGGQWRRAEALDGCDHIIKIDVIPDPVFMP